MQVVNEGDILKSLHRAGDAVHNPAHREGADGSPQERKREYRADVAEKILFLH